MTTYSPLAGSDPPVGSINRIYGFGLTCRTGCGPSPQFKTADVRVTGFKRDPKPWAGTELIVSAGINGTAWQGDSGGPQFYNGLQVGVASSALGANQQQYARVAFYRDWIRSVTGV